MQKRYGEAEALNRECLDIRQRGFPKRDWHIADAKSTLGAALSGQGKYEKAEPLLLAGYQELQAQPPPPALAGGAQGLRLESSSSTRTGARKRKPAQWRASSRVSEARRPHEPTKKQPGGP